VHIVCSTCFLHGHLVSQITPIHLLRWPRGTVDLVENRFHESVHFFTLGEWHKFRLCPDSQQSFRPCTSFVLYSEFFAWGLRKYLGISQSLAKLSNRYIHVYNIHCIKQWKETVFYQTPQRLGQLPRVDTPWSYSRFGPWQLPADKRGADSSFHSPSPCCSAALRVDLNMASDAPRRIFRNCRLIPHIFEIRKTTVDSHLHRPACVACTLMFCQDSVCYTSVNQRLHCFQRKGCEVGTTKAFRPSIIRLPWLRIKATLNFFPE
jgi:hypothetical protein